MKFNKKSIIGILFAAGMGIMTFIGELENQKIQRELETTRERLDKLEKTKGE